MTEIEIYHIHNTNRKNTSRASKYLGNLALIFAIVGVLALAINYLPLIVSDVNLSQDEAKTITQSQQNIRSNYQPPFDAKLSKENRLIIPKIGVNTDIAEATLGNYETALELGVWRVSDFGDPSANSMPTILAAHRYGYLAWSNLFRRQSSFYNLPKLSVGDTVEIDWRQRRYIYEVYAEGGGETITDYTADLILYTCVNLTGKERIFRYARLLSI